jgi:hypothetical protein
MSEAERNFRNMMSEQGIFGREQGSLQQWAKEQAKTEKEREREERSASGEGASGSGAAPDPFGGVISKLDNIISEIKERLPQNALSYN